MDRCWQGLTVNLLVNIVCQYCAPATTAPIMSIGAMAKIDDLNNI